MPVKTKTKPAPEAPPITAIKGFDSALACRGFQFAVGETYKHTGTVKACEGGFHAVTGHPLAVFSYYAPAGSKFCRVMGADGNALFAVERGTDYAILSVAAGIVGRDGIEANAWYRAEAGKLVRAD